jgi:hexosaminidase
MKSTLVLVLLSVVLAPTSSAQTDLHLIPQPREMRVEGSVSVTNGITIGRPVNAEDRFAALDLANTLKDRGIRVVTGESGPGPRVVLMRADASGAQAVLRRHSLTLDPAMNDEGYVITPDGGRIVVIAATSAGVFYGAQTVKQIVSGDGDQARLYRATIRDWPAMRYRGFHDARLPEETNPDSGRVQGQFLLAVLRAHSCLRLESLDCTAGRSDDPR